MRSYIRLSILALPLAILDAQTGSSDAGGVLGALTVTQFAGSGAQSIQAMTSDAAGNIYVAGTTSSLDFQAKNAAQPSIGDALVMRSLDRGLTWQKLPNPPTLQMTITPHPSDPQTLFVAGGDGIYKTTNGGQTWRHVFSATLPPLNILPGCCINIAIDPVNPRNAYAYTFEYSSSIRFLVSSDGGESW